MTCKYALEKENLYTVFDVIDWMDNKIESCKNDETKESFIRVKFSLQVEIADRMKNSSSQAAK